MRWFGLTEYLTFGVIAVLLIGAVATSMIYDRQDRRRRKEWHRSYFLQGGLVRALMSRWDRTPRLTDQSSAEVERQTDA